jgi:hypothetical protein
MKEITIIGIILILGVAGASQYPFGTKVTSVDTDFSFPLRLYGAPNPGTYFSIGYWETGAVLGYDSTDVVYLHQGPLGSGASGVLANDVRLTPFGLYPPGTKVTPFDNDIGQPLALLPNPGGATIAWVNLYGSPGFDFDDPVYIHAGSVIPGITQTATYDIRLTPVGQDGQGSKLGNLDPDLPKTFAPGVAGSSPNPITVTSATTGQILFIWQPSVKYVDINGNNQYDYLDDVYLCAGAPAASAVRANDVRLSGPV